MGQSSSHTATMRSLVFLLTVCGALADTKTSVNVPEVPVDPKLKVDGHDVDFVTTNRRGELFSVLFDEGYSIRDAETLFAVSPSQRGDSGLPELYTGTKEHQFKTDTEGRSVLLLHESGLRIRGKDGIMGRSVVITDPQGAEARHCGIVINA